MSITSGICKGAVLLHGRACKGGREGLLCPVLAVHTGREAHKRILNTVAGSCSCKHTGVLAWQLDMFCKRNAFFDAGTASNYFKSFIDVKGEYADKGMHTPSCFGSAPL